MARNTLGSAGVCPMGKINTGKAFYSISMTFPTMPLPEEERMKYTPGAYPSPQESVPDEPAACISSTFLPEASNT